MRQDRHYKYFILFLLFIAGVICGCKKKASPFSSLPQPVKDCLVFNTGSRWIYQDSATGLTDTQKISTSGYITGDVYPSPYYSSTANNFEWYEGTIISTKDTSWSYIDIKAGHARFVNGAFFTKVYHNNSEPNSTVRIKYPFNDTIAWVDTEYINPDSFKGPDNYDKIKNSMVYKTYLLNGHSYSNVVKVIHSSDLNERRHADCYYYCPHVGLIRLEIPATHRVWNLVQYNVSQ